MRGFPSAIKDLATKTKRRQDDGTEPVNQEPVEYFSPTKKIRKGCVGVNAD